MFYIVHEPYESNEIAFCFDIESVSVLVFSYLRFILMLAYITEDIGNVLIVGMLPVNHV